MDGHIEPAPPSGSTSFTLVQSMGTNWLSISTMVFNLNGFNFNQSILDS